jgi:LysR family transcriptional regulator, glycine cleavage system transcriptional activator
MARRLPPLSSLRVFECAARHLSFTRAGDELCVTQAAVSHQIKALEEWVGTPLFRRLNRTLKLTEAGERMLAPLTQALDLMATATRNAVDGPGATVINVATWDSFLSLWLMPRLHRFRAAHPDIDPRFFAKASDDLLTSGDADVEIRYGGGPWPGVRSERLLEEEIFPVCSPRLLETGPPLTCLADLQHHELLHDVFSVDWQNFLSQFGETGVDTRRGLGFNHSHLVLQACRLGAGVALGRSVLVADDIRQGLLVRPFPEALRSEVAYYVVYREDDAQQPALKAFVEWLLGEASLFHAGVPAHED